MFFKAKRFSYVFNLHPSGAQTSHLPNDIFCQDCFVMPLTVRLKSVVNRVLMVVFSRHPFKVLNLIIEFVKVNMINSPACNANGSGRLTNECKGNKVVHSCHPFFAFILKQYKMVFPDQNVCHNAASNFSTVGGKTGDAPDKTRIADLITFVKRTTGNWFPDNCMHGALYIMPVFPGEEKMLSILERNGQKATNGR